MRDLAPCGTRSAARRHRRHGEPVDEACAVAESRYDTALHIRAGRTRGIHIDLGAIRRLVAAAPAVYDVLCAELGVDVVHAAIRTSRRP